MHSTFAIINVPRANFTQSNLRIWNLISTHKIIKLKCFKKNIFPKLFNCCSVNAENLQEKNICFYFWSLLFSMFYYSAIIMFSADKTYDFLRNFIKFVYWTLFNKQRWITGIFSFLFLASCMHANVLETQKHFEIYNRLLISTKHSGIFYFSVDKPT